MNTYEVEVMVMTDIDGEQIGVDVILTKRDEDGNLVDLIMENTKFLAGYDYDDVEDKDWVVEDEFDSLDEAVLAFRFEEDTMLNYLD